MEQLHSKAKDISNEQDLQLHAQKEGFQHFLEKMNYAQQQLHLAASNTEELFLALEVATQRLNNLSYIEITSKLSKFGSFLLLFCVFSGINRKLLGRILIVTIGSKAFLFAKFC